MSFCSDSYFGREEGCELNLPFSLVNMFRFMDGGGWSMLNVWVAEAKKVQNKSLLVELLQVSSPGDVSIDNRVQS